MKNINFEEEKKELERINRFYKKNQEKRNTIFTIAVIGGIGLGVGCYLNIPITLQDANNGECRI